jgi:hypothetical protein
MVDRSRSSLIQTTRSRRRSCLRRMSAIEDDDDGLAHHGRVGGGYPGMFWSYRGITEIYMGTSRVFIVQQNVAFQVNLQLLKISLELFRSLCLASRRARAGRSDLGLVDDPQRANGFHIENDGEGTMRSRMRQTVFGPHRVSGSESAWSCCDILRMFPTNHRLGLLKRSL